MIESQLGKIKRQISLRRSPDQELSGIIMLETGPGDQRCLSVGKNNSSREEQDSSR